MGNFKLTTVEEFEAATEKLLETGKKVGADAWQYRAAKQTPHCKFGEQGVCCRICAMGPCRITPKAPRGICGCDVHGIVGRNYLYLCTYLPYHTEGTKRYLRMRRTRYRRT